MSGNGNSIALHAHVTSYASSSGRPTELYFNVCNGKSSESVYTTDVGGTGTYSYTWNPNMAGDIHFSVVYVACVKGKIRLDKHELLPPPPNPVERQCKTLGTSSLVVHNSWALSGNTYATMSDGRADLYINVTHYSSEYNIPTELCFIAEHGSDISVGINYPGGFGEYVTVPEKVVYKIPSNMSFEAAAMTEPVACIVHAFETTYIHLGGSAVILGTGFIGLTFLQILKGMGYYPIYVMGRNPVRNKLAKKYGADMIYTNIDDLMKSQIIGKSDLVVEATGDNSILSKTIDMVSPSGKIFAFSVYPPGENVSIDSNRIYSKEISIFGDFINPYTMRKAINMISSGLIDYAGMEDHTISINDIGDLFSSGKKNFIKPLISYE